MATPNQEKTYNEFVKFYDLIDNVVKVVEDSKQGYATEQFNKIEQLVLYIEESTDKLTDKYIKLVRSPGNGQENEEIKELLREIHQKTNECREILIKTYEKNN